MLIRVPNMMLQNIHVDVFLFQGIQIDFYDDGAIEAQKDTNQDRYYTEMVPSFPNVWRVCFCEANSPMADIIGQIPCS